MNAGIAADPRPLALAFRALQLGDLLVAVPALRALRTGLPDHRLLLATSAWLAPVVARRLAPPPADAAEFSAELAGRPVEAREASGGSQGAEIF